MYAYQKESEEQTRIKKNKSNSTGIPSRMKAQFEAVSGFSFDDVRVHYSSQKPTQMRALAYTQGRNVYLGPGQERHLPHELGHVVQQKRQFIPPTSVIAGKAVNTDPKLEASADQFAKKALRYSFEEDFQNKRRGSFFEQPAQCLRITCEKEDEEEEENFYSFAVLPKILSEVAINPGQTREYNWDDLEEFFQEALREYVLEDPRLITETRREQKNLIFQVNGAGKKYKVEVEPKEWYVFLNGGKKSLYERERDFQKKDRVKGGLEDWYEFLNGGGRQRWEREQDFVENFKWMGMPCIASGDQFSVLAAMLSDPHLCLNIYVYKKEENWKPLFSFLTEKLQCEVPSSDENTRFVMKDGVLAIAINRKTNQIIRVVDAVKCKAMKGEGKVRMATEIVANSYNRETKRRFRQAGGLEDDTKDVKLMRWLKKKQENLFKLIKPEKRFIFLWFRLSGKRGEAHPEHDTSFEAMRLLIQELKEPEKPEKPEKSEKSKNDTVIVLAGDDDKGKAKTLADNKMVFDMTEFWKEESENKERESGTKKTAGAGEKVSESGNVALQDWGGDDRIGQTRVYDLINRTAKSVIHIGSRSGNLELLSLIGHKVIYMEEENSIGGERMMVYGKHDFKIPGESPDCLNYHRNVIPRPLTFKGRFVRGAMDFMAQRMQPHIPLTEIPEEWRKLLDPVLNVEWKLQQEKLKNCRNNVEKAKKVYTKLFGLDTEAVNFLSTLSEEECLDYICEVIKSMENFPSEGTAESSQEDLKQKEKAELSQEDLKQKKKQEKIHKRKINILNEWKKAVEDLIKESQKNVKNWEKEEGILALTKKLQQCRKIMIDAMKKKEENEMNAAKDDAMKKKEENKMNTVKEDAMKKKEENKMNTAKDDAMKKEEKNEMDTAKDILMREENLGSIVQKMINSEFEKVEVYKKNQYPEFAGFDFVFRKFLETLFLFTARIRKDNLKEGEKMKKPDDWYQDFTKEILKAVNEYSSKDSRNV